LILVLILILAAVAPSALKVGHLCAGNNAQHTGGVGSVGADKRPGRATLPRKSFIPLKLADFARLADAGIAPSLLTSAAKTALTWLYTGT